MFSLAILCVGICKNFVVGSLSAVSFSLLAFQGIFVLHQFVRVARERLEKAPVSIGVYAYPMLGWQVEGLIYLRMLFLQLPDAFGLTLERDGSEVADVAKGKDVLMNVKGQHVLRCAESSKGQALFYIIAHREAQVPIVFYVHNAKVSSVRLVDSSS